MSTDIVFKTIEECRVELESYTVLAKPHIQHEWVGGEQWTAPRTYPNSYAGMLPVKAARASFGAQDKTGLNPKQDLKLMRYLADHEHLTPFEYNHATLLIECPLFVARQIHRHRTFSYNEISRRYTEADLAYWRPTTLRSQSENNRQASADKEPDGSDVLEQTFQEHIRATHKFYQQLLDNGVCREQARSVLPCGTLTQFYMGGNLRNWVHFLKLRKGEGAQHEVKVIAEKVEAILRELWPEACDALLSSNE